MAAPLAPMYGINILLPIVKYPFWQMTLANKNAVYACVNYGEAFCPGEIEDRSICIDGDIGDVLRSIR